MSPQDQQYQPPNPPGFWDFVSGFGGPQRAPGQGVDHHVPSPFPPQFSYAFPFGGGMHHGPPHPPHPPFPPHPHHGGRHGVQPPPPPFAGPGVGPSPWDQDHDWSGWYDQGHDHDEHGQESRRGCRRRGRHHRHCEDGTDDEGGNQSSADKEKGASPDAVDANMPDPDEVAPEDAEYPPPPYGRDSGARRGHCHGRGRGGYGRGAWQRGRGMHRGRQCPRGGGNGFDFPAMMRSFINHPFFQNMRDQAGRHWPSSSNQADSADSFAPPLDIFNTDRAFVVYVALPGAKKEDIGVDWNPDKNTLAISGVIHRPGDETFLQGLVSAERQVGLFERNITLPPPGLAAEKEDVDGSGITAKMEDGVLIVTVPKTEKEWTEIRKVDIQ